MHPGDCTYDLEQLSKAPKFLLAIAIIKKPGSYTCKQCKKRRRRVWAVMVPTGEVYSVCLRCMRALRAIGMVQEEEKG